MKISELTDSDWDHISMLLHTGWNQRQVAEKYDISYSSFRAGRQMRDRGHPRDKGKAIRRKQVPTADLFPPGVFKSLDKETDPVDILLIVQAQLLGLAKVYLTIMSSGDRGPPNNTTDDERELIEYVKADGVRVKDYINLLKHIGTIALAHMPYRHPKLASLAVTSDTLSELSSMSPEQKVAELDRLLEEAGVVNTQ